MLRQSKNSVRGNPRAVRVLMYHRIVDDDVLDGDPWTISTGQFRRQIERFDRNGFTAITPEDYRLFEAGELNLPKKPIVLTFDDGYIEVYSKVFPVLKEYGMKAVVFVLADQSKRSNVWDEENSHPGCQLMDSTQILELHGAGFEIGSHTLTHPDLTRVSQDKAWDEISRSRMLLEILLNAPVRSFSYPFGYVNEAAKQMVKEAGYANAFGAWTGPVHYDGDPFEIRRIVVRRNFNTYRVAFMMRSPYLRYRWLWWQVKRRWQGRRAVREGGVRKNGENGE